MNATNDDKFAEVRRKKRKVGMIAIVLLFIFTVLALIGLITSFEWLIADLIVALIANILFRIIGKTANTK